MQQKSIKLRNENMLPVGNIMPTGSSGQNGKSFLQVKYEHPR